MRFLANGDFNFPFDWVIYWMKHFYIWSFQSGTPNPDGLIRLPGRIFNFIAFGLFGNIGASYFYLFATLIVAFVAFYFFAQNFLRIRQTSVLLVGSLFFACNPIFLGNLAKVGLVLAAAMLPLCLLAIKAAFERRKFRYFLLLIVCLNISFLHPYNFTVNAAISAIYFAYMAWQHREFVLKQFHKFVMVGVFALLLNAYFILPLASMGTVSKDVISDNVVPTAVDYTALVNVSNTGDLFTGFSLSKNIFLDFDFYDSAYRTIYFLGVFTFYGLLIALFLQAEKRLKVQEKRQAALFLAGFLVLIALATTTFLHLDSLIKFLISMPGGWAFRSPLKWQLYIPLVLFGLLVVLLARVTDKSRLTMIHVGLGITFIMINAYVIGDVYRKILTPRSFENFASLANTDLNQKTLLFVNNNDCMDYLRSNQRVTTELTQLFISKNMQVKRVLADNLDIINLGSYDYVMACRAKPALAATLQERYQFAREQSFADETFNLYRNNQPTEHVYIPEKIYSLDEPQRIADKANFTNSLLDVPLRFVSGEEKHDGTTTLLDIFDNIGPENIRRNAIETTIPATKETRHLYVRTDENPLFYGIAGDTLTLSGQTGNGLRAWPDTKTGVALPTDRELKVRLTDPQLSTTNLVGNYSLEEGLWQQNVSDCYAYDNYPDIDMKLDESKSTDGKKSLRLEARRHIACSGPDQIDVKSGEHYLVHFDYQSTGKKDYAGYHVSFDDPAQTFIQERLSTTKGEWGDYSREVRVPEGATHMRLMLYAYPDGNDETKTVTTYYDKVSITKIPPLQDRFYIVSGSDSAMTPPRTMEFDVVDPTKKAVRIRGATKPFFLATTETYSPLWRLGINQGSAGPFAKVHPVATEDQLKLNNTMSAWYIDPGKLCKQANENCARQSDGSYDFDMTIEFLPQRSFYVGGIISLVAAVGGGAYYLYDRKRDSQRTTLGRWLWRKR